MNIDEGLKEKYDNLLIKFNEKSNEDIPKEQNLDSDLNIIISNQQFNISCLNDELNNLRETINNIDKQQIEQLNNENEERIHDLTNELQQTKETKDNIQLLLDQAIQQQTDLKEKYEQVDKQQYTG
jgi:translation initiation factor 2 beta subunit (eIF-2beta)/eIF-5